MRKPRSTWPYRPDSYFYYLTGGRRRSSLVAGPDGDRQILFCRRRDPGRETWDGFRYGPVAARAKSSASTGPPINELDARLPDLVADRPLVTRRSA